MKTAYHLSSALMTSYALRLLIKTKGDLIPAIFTLFLGTLGYFVAMDLTFFTIERIVLEKNFIHAGDYLVWCFLMLRFFWLIRMLINLRREMNVSVFLLA